MRWMTSFIESLLRLRQRPVVRVLYYALILVSVAVLAANQATATPGFIHQNF